MISNGKKLTNYIQRYITRSKKRDINKPLLEDIQKFLAVEKTKIEEAELSEKLKAELTNIKPKQKKKKIIPQKDEYQRDKIKLGSTVKLIATKQSGTVEEMNGELLTVVFGFMRMKVEKEKLMWVKN